MTYDDEMTCDMLIMEISKCLSMFNIRIESDIESNIKFKLLELRNNPHVITLTHGNEEYMPSDSEIVCNMLSQMMRMAELLSTRNLDSELVQAKLLELRNDKFILSLVRP